MNIVAMRLMHTNRLKPPLRYSFRPTPMRWARRESTDPPRAHALTAYLRRGKWVSFFFCFRVFAAFSF